MQLYDSNGYFDFPAVRKLGYPFNLITGGRGTGKTFGGLVDMIETHTDFIFMRRTQTQLDAISTEQLRAGISARARSPSKRADFGSRSR